jgi:hypothetical protein
VFLGVVAMIAQSCQKLEHKTISVNLDDILIEGPVFSGPNVGQSTFSFNLSDYPDLSQLKDENIKNIKLISSKIKNNTGDLSLYSDLTVQLASENTNMQKIAYINPIDGTNSAMDLTIVEEQENLAPFFMDKDITFVMDINVTADTMANLNLAGEFIFDFTIKN